MTTGSRVLDGRFWENNLPAGHGSSFIGPYFSKVWSGGDAITPSTPRSSFAVKRFRGQLVSRGAPMPPQNYSTVINIQNVGLYWMRPNGYWQTSDIQPVPAYDIREPAAVDSAQEYKLIDKLHAAVYGSGFHPGVFTAEGRKSISLIGESARRIGSGLSRLKARDPYGVAEALGIEPHIGFIRNLRDLSKGLSRCWLEVKYGWEPLLKDAEEGARWIAEMVHGNTPIRLVRTRSWGETKVSTQQSAGRYFSARSDLFKLRYEIESVNVRNSTLLPNIYSVAGVAWETLPYSFVFDWFVPIGSYLQALRTANDLEGRTVRSLKQETIWHDLVDRNGWDTQLAQPVYQPTSFRKVQFSRTVASGIWVPPPITEQTLARLPEYNSWRHAVSAVALLAVGDLRRLSMIRT